ncbi:glycoside hydrolase family 73 protein [Heyndrickxia sp. NPDC080065]|uniref:glycoside hydrolase family 73 protein n=1 Tax=Heyndrickxia sp. NPDC080065 TaxID=3390568 RepID=UPI003CFCE03B
MTFISEIAPHAQRIQKEYGILASLVIAQAIHESNWGKSGLAVKGKNLFGIKGSFNGQFVTMRTAEYNKKGNKYYIDAAFRKYPSWYESLCDLANLYKNGVSWDRNKYKKIIGETDYKKAAKAVQSAGYATDPNYAAKVIATIEANKLTQYDGKKVEKPTEVKPSKKVHLPATDSSWRVYPTNKAPVVGNEIGKLNPKKFGGLSYDILGNPQKDVYTIQTRDFGKVNIYAAPSTGSKIKNE